MEQGDTERFKHSCGLFCVVTFNPVLSPLSTLSQVMALTDFTVLHLEAGLWLLLVTASFPVNGSVSQDLKKSYNENPKE